MNTPLEDNSSSTVNQKASSTESTWQELVSIARRMSGLKPEQNIDMVW